MIKPEDLREQVIRPTLRTMAEFNPKLYSEAAVELLMGTAAQESDLGYNLVQVGGPALGIYQIEPATHDSIWENYLKYRPDLASIVRGFASQHAFDSQESRDNELIVNLTYSTAIARLVYWPKTQPLPSADDIEGQGEYWDLHYNGNPYKGTPEEYIDSYNEFVR